MQNMQNLDTRHPMHFLIGLSCRMTYEESPLYQIIGAVEAPTAKSAQDRYYLVLHREGHITYATTAQIRLVQPWTAALDLRLCRHNREML